MIIRWLMSDLELGACTIWLNLTNECKSKVLEYKNECESREKIKKLMN